MMSRPWMSDGLEKYFVVNVFFRQHTTEGRWRINEHQTFSRQRFTKLVRTYITLN